MNIAHIFDTYFNGEKNFFTTKIYGYAKKHIVGDFYLVFEKSENKVLSDNITYGCSVLLFKEQDKLIKNIDLSELFATKEELEEYIENITVEDAMNATTYGETVSLTHGFAIEIIKLEE